MLPQSDESKLTGRGGECSRRQFVGQTAVAAASASLFAAMAGGAEPAKSEQSSPPKTFDRKIKIGLVGCGGRGTFISKHFLDHGGYELHAVADYFPQNAQRLAKARGVDEKRCFSGLSGYKRVIESGVEAVILQVPTGFFPEHGSAAVDAGLHVYMAKPVAVDVPGCTRIEAAGKLATQKRRVFLVDYQLPTEPINIDFAERVRKGEIGPLAKVITVGYSGGHKDPPREATIENRLTQNIWDNDLAIGGASILCFDVHSIDAAIWVLGQRPVAAMGASRICRPDPHSDGPDISGVVYEYADGLIHEHSSQHMPNAMPGEISCTLLGQTGTAVVDYFKEAKFLLRGKKEVTGEVTGLYANGAKRNIASFYDAVTQGQCDNPTVRRAVDGCLTCILGRQAAARHGRMTMDELLKENKRLEMDLTGLKV